MEIDEDERVTMQDDYRIKSYYLNSLVGGMQNPLSRGPRNNSCENDDEA